MPKQTQTPPKTPTDSWTILSLIQWTSAYFESHGIDSPRSTAEILLAHTLEISRLELYLRYDQPMVSSELTCYKAFIRRRIRREPVAYIVGQKEFWSMPLKVNRQVLIPRPETECLVEQALTEIPENPVSQPIWVLELGTGSGAIILALAKERPDHRYVALDKRLEAVMLSRQNAVLNGLGESVHFFCGDWFSSFPASKVQFDLIVANPPYVRSADIDGLQPEVFQYEPRLALDGGQDGVGCLRHIIETAPDYLRAGGVLVLEIGYDQAESVIDIATHRNAYKGIYVGKDFSGLARVVRMTAKKL